MTRWRRGLFRLWVALSVIWIGLVVVVTWPAADPWAVDPWAVVKQEPSAPDPFARGFWPPGYTVDKPKRSLSDAEVGLGKPPFDPDAPYTVPALATWSERKNAALFALVPPALLGALMLGAGWVVQGFRK
jgi:hypothetical protein